MIRVELSVAGCLFGLYALFLLFMFVALRTRASRARGKNNGTATLTPQIRDALVDYISGSNDQTRIREFARGHREELVASLLEFYGTVGGSARDRLCDLALELGVVHGWCEDAASKDQAVRRQAYVRLSFVCAYEPCRRMAGDLLQKALADPDPEIRLAAARALVQSGTTEELGQVFRLAVSQSLLIRILLSEDLRRHATELCERTIPEILASDNPAHVLAALEILVAWERALPLQDLHRLMESGNREIRLEALRLAKLVPLTRENRSALLRYLREGDEDENTAAALTAGRLRLQEALPSLARCLRSGTSELAGIAASALAEMPPKGWQTLQQIAGGEDSAALIAAAALDRGRRKAGV